MMWIEELNASPNGRLLARVAASHRGAVPHNFWSHLLTTSQHTYYRSMLAITEEDAHMWARAGYSTYLGIVQSHTRISFTM